MFEGTDREIVIQESVYSRKGADRLLKYAFDLAQSRAKKHVTLATKSNGIAISMPWWDKRADEVAKAYPEVTLDKQHIDILTARFVLQPGRFDVVAATNLFGDILSDLGPATTGTIGLAPSANLNPERSFPSLFEPVHGSAPDIYGKNIANPIAMIWSGALMLDFLGHSQGPWRAAHDAIVKAIEDTIKSGPRTPDLGGTANTTEVGQAIAAHIAGRTKTLSPAPQAPHSSCHPGSGWQACTVSGACHSPGLRQSSNVFSRIAQRCQQLARVLTGLGRVAAHGQALASHANGQQRGLGSLACAFTVAEHHISQTTCGQQMGSSNSCSGRAIGAYGS